MLFSTPTQYAVLALLFVGGWLLGLASHPGGRKWRERIAPVVPLEPVKHRLADGLAARERQ